MKIWINEYIKKARIYRESFERDGLEVVKIVIVFRNGDEINMHLTQNDYKQLKEVVNE